MGLLIIAHDKLISSKWFADDSGSSHEFTWTAVKNLDNMIEYVNTAFLARLNQQNKFTLSAFFITHECMRLALR